MPKSLDMLIGLSVIMPVVSMTVTMLTQAATSLFNSDGNKLFDGLRNLLVQIDPDLSGIADELTTAILTHPLIADSRGRLGSVIHRDEFTKLILDLAAGTGAKKLAVDSRTTLVSILRRNGIAEPGAILDKIRITAMKLEAAHPEWASSFCHDAAILQEAGSQFVAKMNDMFDQTIDRVSARFTASARGAALVCALVVAFVLQLDTVGLINSLWMSDSLRSQLVNLADVTSQAEGKALPVVPDAAASEAPKALGIESPAQVTPTAPPADTAQRENHENCERNIKELRQLASHGLLVLPDIDLSAWWNSWANVKIPGVILSSLLLSLGAPFWYNTLKTLLGIKEKIAAKDEAQRATRETSQGNGGRGPTQFVT